MQSTFTPHQVRCYLPPPRPPFLLLFCQGVIYNTANELNSQQCFPYTHLPKQYVLEPPLNSSCQLSKALFHIRDPLQCSCEHEEYQSRTSHPYREICASSGKGKTKLDFAVPALIYVPTWLVSLLLREVKWHFATVSVL